LQILADILNLNINTINTTEGGALGAIILAMVGCGRFKNVSTACKVIIKNTKIFKPNAALHQKYLQKFRA
jgi:xylulokinase